MDKFHLRDGGNTTVAVALSTVRHGNNGYVAMRSDDGGLLMLYGNAVSLAQRLREIAGELDQRTIAEIEATGDWERLTPEMVVRKFETSPVLAEYAADVRAMLETATGELDQLSQDVEALAPHRDELVGPDGGLVRGYTATAAAILFDDRLKTGGAYLKRIKAAIQKLAA